MCCRDKCLQPYLYLQLIEILKLSSRLVSVNIYHQKFTPSAGVCLLISELFTPLQTSTEHYYNTYLLLSVSCVSLVSPPFYLLSGLM